MAERVSGVSEDQYGVVSAAKWESGGGQEWRGDIRARREGEERKEEEKGRKRGEKELKN